MLEDELTQCSALVSEMDVRPADENRLIAYRLSTASSISIEPSSPDRDWMKAGKAEFANRCLPLRIANQCGWAIQNPYSFEATWSGGNDAKSITLRHENDRDEDSAFVASHFGYGILTWKIPFVFRLPAGWNLRVRGPVNQPKDAISPLEGVVEADWSVASFTMNWKFTRSHTPISFREQEPFCVIVPEKRGTIEEFTPEFRPIASAPQLLVQHNEWKESRKRILGAHRLRDFSKKWEKHYFLGTHPSASDWKFEDHQLALRIKPFIEAEESR